MHSSGVNQDEAEGFGVAYASHTGALWLNSALLSNNWPCREHSGIVAVMAMVLDPLGWIRVRGWEGVPGQASSVC